MDDLILRLHRRAAIRRAFHLVDQQSQQVNHLRLMSFDTEQLPEIAQELLVSNCRIALLLEEIAATGNFNPGGVTNEFRYQ